MSADHPQTTTMHPFKRGQLDMQHRAAEAIIRSSAGKGYNEAQRQLLADAATAVLSLEVQA